MLLPLRSFSNEFLSFEYIGILDSDTKMASEEEILIDKCLKLNFNNSIFEKAKACREKHYIGEFKIMFDIYDAILDKDISKADLEVLLENLAIKMVKLDSVNLAQGLVFEHLDKKRRSRKI